MNRFFASHKVLLLVSVLGMSIVAAQAQVLTSSLENIQSQEELTKVVASLDAALFDSYNRCDLEKFASFIADDVEFYHDQGGVTLGKQNLTDSVKKNICGKVTRELVPGSLQVYHMNGYGAVEMGVHRFHHPGHDDTEAIGEAKFIHLWQYKDNAWKITRVISYEHHAVAK
jgi:ketosteroid isomerase-like protein